LSRFIAKIDRFDVYSGGKSDIVRTVEQNVLGRSSEQTAGKNASKSTQFHDSHPVNSYMTVNVYHLDFKIVGKNRSKLLKCGRSVLHSFNNLP